MSTPADTALRSYKTIALERKGRLLTMTLNRPDTLNAVNRGMHEELSDAFNFAALDEHSDVVVLTGAGRAFSAGGDLGTWRRMPRIRTSSTRTYASQAHRLRA